MDDTKTTTNWIIAGLVALAVIIGGGWLIARERSATNLSDVTSTSDKTASSTDNKTTTDTKTTADTKTSTQTPSDKTASAVGETVTVADQPAGAMVIVEGLQLTKPSWVVIRDTNQWALGAAWFPSSITGVEVSLLRNTVAGQTYQAVIYVDDGDKKFSVHGGDMLVADSEGAPVSSTFTAK